jgi:hypothetical protein
VWMSGSTTGAIPGTVDEVGGVVVEVVVEVLGNDDVVEVVEGGTVVGTLGATATDVVVVAGVDVVVDVEVAVVDVVVAAVADGGQSLAA